MFNLSRTLFAKRLCSPDRNRDALGFLCINYLPSWKIELQWACENLSEGGHKTQAPVSRGHLAHKLNFSGCFDCQNNEGGREERSVVLRFLFHLKAARLNARKPRGMPLALSEVCATPERIMQRIPFFLG